MIQSIRREDFTPAYGIQCRRVYEPGDQTPFGSTWCAIEPGGSTAPHDHFEGETFFILEGHGRMTIDGNSRAVTGGDVVYIPAHSNHVLENLSNERELNFLSIYWEGEAPSARATRAMVSVAPPTPNGDLHVGHLSGPYIASDIHARYLRARGVETKFVSGSDDNQSYVPVKGKKLGLSADATVEKYAPSIQGTLKKADVALDYFLSPRKDAEYTAFVQRFFTQLFENGKIVAKTAPALFCVACDRFVHEAHARGICPHCDTATNANGCEKCGFFNDGVDLKDPHCNSCDAALVTRDARRLFFPLPDYRDRLAQYFGEVKATAGMKKYMATLLEKLPEVSASYVADWGIPVPVPGFEGQVIYEWLEMAAGYLYMARGHFSDPAAEVVQFFGWDNGFFYTSFIPALLLAHDAAAKLPAAFVTNEFYRLDGLKFSTSRNHAIWGDELLEQVPADVVRYYLGYSRPEAEQTNFTVAEMLATVARDLVGGWEAWLSSLDEKLAMQSSRVSPEAEPLTPAQARFGRRLENLAAEALRGYEADGFSLNRVARALNGIVDETRRCAREGDATTGLELGAARLLARVAYPLMPTFATKLLAALGDHETKLSVGFEFLPAGRAIGSLNDRTFSRGLVALENFKQRV